MSEKISLSELPLATELAVGLARQMNNLYGRHYRQDIGPNYVCHPYTSVSEGGFGRLWSLGIARAAYGPESNQKDLTLDDWRKGSFPRTMPPYFKFLQELDIRKLGEALLTPDRPSITELLGTYLDVNSNYGAPHFLLHTGKGMFDVPHEYLGEFEALSAAGYVRSIDAKFEWTDQVREAMQDGLVSLEVWGRPNPK